MLSSSNGLAAPYFALFSKAPSISICKHGKGGSSEDLYDHGVAVAILQYNLAPVAKCLVQLSKAVAAVGYIPGQGDAPRDLIYEKAVIVAIRSKLESKISTMFPHGSLTYAQVTAPPATLTVVPCLLPPSRTTLSARASGSGSVTQMWKNPPRLYSKSTVLALKAGSRNWKTSKPTPLPVAMYAILTSWRDSP